MPNLNSILEFHMLVHVYFHHSHQASPPNVTGSESHINFRIESAAHHRRKHLPVQKKKKIVDKYAVGIFTQTERASILPKHAQRPIRINVFTQSPRNVLRHLIAINWNTAILDVKLTFRLPLVRCSCSDGKCCKAWSRTFALPSSLRRFLGIHIAENCDNRTMKMYNNLLFSFSSVRTYIDAAESTREAMLKKWQKVTIFRVSDVIFCLCFRCSAAFSIYSNYTKFDFILLLIFIRFGWRKNHDNKKTIYHHGNEMKVMIFLLIFYFPISTSFTFPNRIYNRIIYALRR